MCKHYGLCKRDTPTIFADSAMTEAKTSLLVRFECLSAKTITTNEIELPPVSTVQQIKEYFEEKHDIPACLQTIRHCSVVLKQDTPVASLRLRHGDELHVSYYAKAECQEMRRVIRWLEAYVTIVQQDGDQLSQQDDEEQVLEDMVNYLFLPWGSPVKTANKNLFVSYGGLSLTIQLHKYLLSYQWLYLPDYLKLMEGQVLLVQWALCENASYRLAIYNEGGLKNAINSVLRVQIYPHLSITDTSTPEDNFALVTTIERAVEFLGGYVCKLCLCVSVRSYIE